MTVRRWVIICFLMTFGQAAVASQGGSFKAVWSSSNSHQDLKAWTADELGHWKTTTTREKDPKTEQLVRWKGVTLSQVVEKAIEGLTVEQRAQIDLVVVKNAVGEEAYIPRALIVKYPLLLALPEQGSGFSVVVPWTSKPKILSEDLPLERYFLSNASQIELANYKEKYGPYFLKRRTDPAAIRGEKIFVQNCIGCHSPQKGMSEAKARSLAAVEHPTVKGNPKLSDRNRRSLISYLDAYKGENQTTSKR